MERSAWSTKLDAARLLRWWLLPGLLLPVGCERPREPEVARVDGAGIPQVDVGIELRAILWRRGEAWDNLDEATKVLRRQESLDRCVDQRLLASFSKQAALVPATQARASEESFQQFLKQFEPPEGWKPRLETQDVSELEMRDRVTAAVMQGSAIEDWLKKQRAQTPEQTESEARTWFEKHREQLRIPEHARVSHVFLTGHDQENPERSAEIAELHRRLTAGEATLEALAAKSSEDERSKSTGGSLGWISRDRVPVDFAEQVFALPLKKPSAPFRTKLGWHIVVVHERRAARLPEFAELRDEILARLDQAWRETAVKRLTQELRAKAKVEVREDILRLVAPAGMEN